jgi:hypothetical protein
MAKGKWFSVKYSLPIKFRKCEGKAPDGTVYAGVAWSETGQAWISPSGFKFPWEVEYWRYL